MFTDDEWVDAGDAVMSVCEQQHLNLAVSLNTLLLSQLEFIKNSSRKAKRDTCE